VLQFILQCILLSLSRSLRTLEFWVDNLNPDFLYPELAKQTLLFTELMQALSRHLRPAPYPYGLLTLRLLGKLGGKSRRFLREPVELCAEESIRDVPPCDLSIQCRWVGAQDPNFSNSSAQEHTSLPSGEFSLPIPLERCVEVLKLLAATEDLRKSQIVTRRKSSSGDSGTSLRDKPFTWKDSGKLWVCNVEDVDFASYCSGVMDDTRNNQAEAALQVLQSALAAILETENIECRGFEIDEIPSNDSDTKREFDSTEMKHGEGLFTAAPDLESRCKDFFSIGLGLMYGSIVESTKDEALLVLDGFATNIFFLVASHHSCFVRIDANGSPIKDDRTADSATEKPLEGQPASEQLGSLKPFGYYHRVGVLSDKVDPLELNRALAEFLSERSGSATKVGLLLVRNLLRHGRGLACVPMKQDTTKEGGDERSSELHRGSFVYFENLLSNLCISCSSKEWNRRSGLQESICTMIEELGREWALKYEAELMNVAFFVIKSVPQELSTAVVKALQFFVRVCYGLYGRPAVLCGENVLVWDALAVIDKKSSKKESVGSAPAPQNDDATSIQAPSSSVLLVLFSEMAATKQIVR
jgi:hypothetical protein